MPEAARERVTNPARGNRTRSVSGIVSRNALTRARFTPVTEEETYVNGKVTAIVPFLPRVCVRKFVAVLAQPAHAIIQML
jgi:hypothetical protein